MDFTMKVEEAKCTNVNLGSEGNESNPVSRTDINFSGVTTKEAFAHLIGDESLANAFWDEAQNLVGLGITEIASRGILENCTISFLGTEVEAVKAKNFKMCPLSRHVVKVSLQCQVHHNADQLVKIDRWQRQVSTLEVKTNSTVTVPKDTKQKDLLDPDPDGGAGEE